MSAHVRQRNSPIICCSFPSPSNYSPTDADPIDTHRSMRRDETLGTRRDAGTRDRNRRCLSFTIADIMTCCILLSRILDLGYCAPDFDLPSCQATLKVKKVKIVFSSKRADEYHISTTRHITDFSTHCVCTTKDTSSGVWEAEIET